MSIISLLASDNFITVNRDLVRALGLEAAVLLGEFAAEANYWIEEGKTDDGYFFSTIENIEDRTSLSVYQQKNAINILTEKGLIDVQRRGLPARRYIKINEENLTNLLTNKFVKNSQTRTREINKLDAEKFATIKDKKEKTKEKDKKKEICLSSDLFDIIDSVKIIQDNPRLREAMVGFIDYRKMIKKPLTEKALKLNINKAYELSGGDPIKMKEIVEQSIARGWSGMFPLKDEKPAQGGTENFFEKIIREADDAGKNDWNGSQSASDSFPILF